MSELLAELGALDDDPPPQDSAGRERKLSVGALIDKAAEGGFGFVIGVLTLIAIPFFGLSTPFGLAIALIGGQMMIGRTQPWLPRRARRRELSMAMLDRVATMLARRTRWIVKLTRRRSEGLLQPRLIGFGIMLLALGLALPLPIPGSNLVFLIPIFIYALGILERDGVWIAVGHACVIVDLALMFVFGKTIVLVLGRLVAWIF
ncbi:MAG: exopolysaccharide biosynthesis protein [Myxococcota bacterium]|nr:exopolysaccharide biosynthesis protein [Myxococcota bacterium]